MILPATAAAQNQPNEDLVASLRLAVKEVIGGLLKQCPQALPLQPTLDAEIRGDAVLIAMKIRGQRVSAAAIKLKALLAPLGRAAVVKQLLPQLVQLQNAWAIGYNDCKALHGIKDEGPPPKPPAVPE